MRQVAALALTVGLGWLVVSSAPEETGNSIALGLGIALIAAALSGSLLERLGLPRVTGYLLFGLVCGPYALNIITRGMARELQLINGLAVVLIAFVAGLEINLAQMRPRLAAIFRVSAVSMALLYAGLFAAFWLAWGWLPFAGDYTTLQRTAIVAVLTTVVASYSPTVTIALIAESRASGPLSELTLAIVILADLVLILAFTLVMQGVRYAFGGSGHLGLLVSLSWEIFGSFAFGAAVGAVFALYLRYIGREVALALLVMCTLLVVGGRLLHLEALLAAVTAGLVVENIAPPRGDMLKHAVERGALPVLVVFFAAAGASLQMDALAAVGLLACSIAAWRGFLIWGGMRIGTRYAGIERPAADHAWMGLISQAGVTLGLTLIVAAEYPTWGTTVQTLCVALIAIHQLAGPMIFRSALSRTGEVGRMDAGSAELRP